MGNAEIVGNESQREGGAEVRRLALFEDRYGVGAYQRLTHALAQPCVTFAEIALQFGVTRERVRQWHRDYQPGAPSGHARQRACADHRQRRRLFSDPLFRAFHANARRHLPPGSVLPIRARDGFRTNCARINGRLVVLQPSLRRYRGSAAFVYVQLAADEFLFLPSARVPARQPATLDAAGLSAFRNTFDALAREAGTR